MKIRAHDFSALGWCVHCGAASWERIVAWHAARGQAVPAEDARQCRERDLGRQPLMPEPQRRQLAHEDAAAIAARIAELRKEAELAQIVKHCAAMQGRPKAECHQCEAGEKCKACARACGGTVPQCPICWKTPAKPCPT